MCVCVCAPKTVFESFLETRLSLSLSLSLSLKKRRLERRGNVCVQSRRVRSFFAFLLFCLAGASRRDKKKTGDEIFFLVLWVKV